MSHALYTPRKSTGSPRKRVLFELDFSQDAKRKQ